MINHIGWRDPGKPRSSDISGENGLATGVVWGGVELNEWQLKLVWRYYWYHYLVWIIVNTRNRVQFISKEMRDRQLKKT